MIQCAWCQQTMSGQEDARCISHGICKPCMDWVEGEFADCCASCPTAYEQEERNAAPQERG